jgi:peroxiredoxin
LTFIGVSIAALALVLGAVCVFIYHIMVQHGKILLRLEVLETGRSFVMPPAAQGYPAGSVLHDFELSLLGGGEMRLSQWRGKNLLLIFFDPGCSHCRKMAPQLATLKDKPTSGEPQVLVISTGDATVNRKLLGDLRVPVLLQERGELAMMYQVPGTPAGYLADESGITTSGLIIGASALMEAAESKTAATAPFANATTDLSHSQLVRDGLRAGTVAPDFLLPTPRGEEIALSQYRGRKVMLVFSDPECTPCNALAPHLESAHRNGIDCQILMVSRGNPDVVGKKVAEFGFTFPVVMQRKWEISREYGIFAVPVAFLIDESGIISREVMTGLDPILSLLNQVGKSQPEAVHA